jgi:hypothetical protein
MNDKKEYESNKDKADRMEREADPRSNPTYGDRTKVQTGRKKKGR